MFGNSYTAFIIQINNREVGSEIWEKLKGSAYGSDLERLHIRFYDLDVIVLQGTSDSIASLKQMLIPMIDEKYGLLVKSRAIIFETCSNLAKNTFLRGNIIDEEADSIECVRMSLMFYGYADILPFLSLINVSSQLPSSPPQHYGSPRHIPPRPVAIPPRSAIPPPRNPRSAMPPRNPPPRPTIPPRSAMLPRNPPPRSAMPPRNPPPRNPRPNLYRNMYAPRPLPPRPSYGNAPRPRL